jgi:hypothetical protein
VNEDKKDEKDMYLWTPVMCDAWIPIEKEVLKIAAMKHQSSF